MAAKAEILEQRRRAEVGLMSLSRPACGFGCAELSG